MHIMDLKVINTFRQRVYLNNNNFFYDTLDSGISIGVRLLIFGLFSRGYVLIREGNAYLFSKYPLFDGILDAYFKGYA